MPANPERMSHTKLSFNPTVIEANKIVCEEAVRASMEPDQKMAQRAVIFIAGIQRRKRR